MDWSLSPVRFPKREGVPELAVCSSDGDRSCLRIARVFATMSGRKGANREIGVPRDGEVLGSCTTLL